MSNFSQGTSGFAVEPVGRPSELPGSNLESRSSVRLIDAAVAAPDTPVPMYVIPPPKVGPQQFDVKGAYGAFTDGLSNGFYASDLQKFRQTLNARAAGLDVSAEQVSSELLNLSLRMGVAEAFSKMASKSADFVQALVVRQG